MQQRSGQQKGNNQRQTGGARFSGGAGRGRFDLKKFGKKRNDFRDRSRVVEEKEFEEKMIDLARVTRVTAGGKRFSFRATMVLGDQKGRVGIGVAKGQDVAQAVSKAKAAAKKNMVKLSLSEHSIPYEVSAKYCAAKVILKPASKGHGLVAGGATRIVCSLAGIKDISAKILGTTGNKLNNAQATLEALKKLKVQSPKSKI